MKFFKLSFWMYCVDSGDQIKSNNTANTMNQLNCMRPMKCFNTIKWKSTLKFIVMFWPLAVFNHSKLLVILLAQIKNLPKDVRKGERVRSVWLTKLYIPFFCYLFSVLNIQTNTTHSLSYTYNILIFRKSFISITIGLTEYRLEDTFVVQMNSGWPDGMGRGAQSVQCIPKCKRALA